jgi:hypothetical protein
LHDGSQAPESTGQGEITAGQRAPGIVLADGAADGIRSTGTDASPPAILNQSSELDWAKQVDS